MTVTSINTTRVGGQWNIVKYSGTLCNKIMTQTLYNMT